MKYVGNKGNHIQLQAQQDQPHLLHPQIYYRCHKHDKANMISVISISHSYATDSESGLAPNCTNFTDLGAGTLDVPGILLLWLLCS